MSSIPHEKGLPIIGHTLTAARNPLGFLGSLNIRYPDMVKVSLLGKTYHVIQSPEICQHILQKNFKNYYKPGEAKELKRFLGEGLATSNGDLWLKQRRLIQPAFHRKKIESLMAVINDETDMLIRQWKSRAFPQKQNINEQFRALTLANITKAMFGTDLKGDLEEVSEIVETLLRLGTQKATSIIKVPHYIPTPSNLRLKRLNHEFEKLIYSIIEKRKNAPEAKSDDESYNLLDMLLRAYDDQSQSYMTSKQLRDEIVTIFMAGHETTAQTLSWVFYHLAALPAVYERVKTEVDSFGSEPLSLETLQGLTHSRNVIEETLRMYPPVWIIVRKSYAEDQITSQLKLPAGSTVLLNIYGLHHNPAYWSSPESFDPDSFASDKEALESSFTYLPFGGGPRVCIGKQFAMMVMQTVVYRLIQEFEFEVPAGFNPDVVPGFTLRTKRDIELIVKARSRKTL